MNLLAMHTNTHQFQVKTLDRKTSSEESILLPDVPRYLLASLSRGPGFGRLGGALIGGPQTSFSPQMSAKGGELSSASSAGLASGFGAFKDFQGGNQALSHHGPLSLHHAGGSNSRDVEGDSNEKEGREGSKARGARYSRERGKYVFNADH